MCAAISLGTGWVSYACWDKGVTDAAKMGVVPVPSEPSSYRCTSISTVWSSADVTQEQSEPAGLQQQTANTLMYIGRQHQRIYSQDLGLMAP